MSQALQRHYRADYQPPAYWIDDVALSFDIQDNNVEVTAEMAVRRNTAGPGGPWRLDGRGMRLVRIAIDGADLGPDAYHLTDTSLELADLPAAFTLTVVTEIDPERNLALEGLYRSGAILCTQCEATGFSRMTYWPDRPDVMARFITRVEADAARYPVLLSNGNCVDSGPAQPGRHFAVYEDPFAKPCYLFALVAGDLGVIRDIYTTASGREVALAVFTEHGNEAQCHHAMDSLKAAMAWDEATYGLEYDLDQFFIVAVASFNMGAMENKGLNIFNTACVFAHSETATDADFARVRDVVAHEYFHNYTGNRVTCRDWFQLSLKEGLTVYREHQFAIDHGSPGVTRIEQVRVIRDIQFPEDAGPRAHPVRPDSYVEMNNFYTITVYEKGAELIRMMAQMAGEAAFTEGVTHYLAKHDGQAVTIEDFVGAIEEQTGLDLGQFRHWYSQAGTPRVQLTQHHADNRLVVSLSQHTPATPGQPDKPVFDIPVALAVFDAEGGQQAAPRIVRLDQGAQDVVFDDIAAPPVVSALRGLSAPVKLEQDTNTADLACLMAYDTDPVARWDAAQSLYLSHLCACVAALQAGQTCPALPEHLAAAIERLLSDWPDDRALLAEMLELPSTTQIGEAFEAIDVLPIEDARRSVKQQIGSRFTQALTALCDAHASNAAYVFSPAEAGRRRVFALTLDYLAEIGAPDIEARLKAIYEHADNMSDRMAALGALQHCPGGVRDALLADFAERFADQPLVMDKWLRLQVSAPDIDALAKTRELLADPRFDFTNPNRLRALLGGLVRGNARAFHRADGAGYALLVDEILRVDGFNPQMAAALAGLIAPWQRYAGRYGQGMKAGLSRLSEAELSANTREIVASGLGQTQADSTD